MNNDNFNLKLEVEGRLKEISQSRGISWILGLSYYECNDFAHLIMNQVSDNNNFRHIRFESVARYIRIYKAELRKVQFPSVPR